jgi:hypothetical protein
MTPRLTPQQAADLFGIPRMTLYTRLYRSIDTLAFVPTDEDRPIRGSGRWYMTEARWREAVMSHLDPDNRQRVLGQARDRD